MAKASSCYQHSCFVLALGSFPSPNALFYVKDEVLRASKMALQIKGLAIKSSVPGESGVPHDAQCSQGFSLDSRDLRLQALEVLVALQRS